MDQIPLTRRTALKYAGLIALAAGDWRIERALAVPSTARGYGIDPDLLQRPVTWPCTLSSGELTTLAVLCDIVLPADLPHQAASAIGVHDFLDEWLSAPYPQMQADRKTVLGGLEILDERSRSAHRVRFKEAGAAEQTAVFDGCCSDAATAASGRRVIELICAGYYTTREGHAAIGYVGNVPLERFPGPPAEVVRHLEKALKLLPV